MLPGKVKWKEAESDSEYRYGEDGRHPEWVRGMNVRNGVRLFLFVVCLLLAFCMKKRASRWGRPFEYADIGGG